METALDLVLANSPGRVVRIPSQMTTSNIGGDMKSDL